MAYNRVTAETAEVYHETSYWICFNLYCLRDADHVVPSS